MSRLDAVPLRWRLTMLYTTLLAVFLLALDLFAYSELRRALVQGEQSILATNLSALATLVAADGGPSRAALGRQLAPGVAFQLTDSQGDVVAMSGSPGDFPSMATPTPPPTPPARRFPPFGVGPTVQPDAIAQTVEGAGGPWLVLTTVVVGRARLPATLRVATSLAPIDGALATLARILAGGSLAIVALALAIGPAVASGALQPLRKMARTAERLAAGDLSQRTAQRHGDDEVGNLARSFDDMAARLERSFAEQRATEERLRRFAADASHELRTPLTAVRGYIDVLLRGAKDDPDDATNALEAMRRDAQRLERLTTDLLDLTRLDAASAGPRAPVRLDTLVAQLIEELPAEGPALSWSRREQVTVAGDAAGLRRAVGNLLENARRYTPPGGEVGVSVFEHEAVATIEVRDSGIGIPAADLPHVFERFYRGDSARSRDTGGCGLGLSIVKAIVEAHGGRVSAESAFGEGSVFTIRMMTVPFP